MAHRSSPFGLAAALAAALVLALAPAPAPATGEEGAPRIVLGESVSVGYVLVPVTVRDADGHVDGLGPDAFRLLVDGERIDFESFERGPEAAIDLLFLQDLSGSMEIASRLELSRRAIRCLLAAPGGGSRFAAATFAGGRLEVVAPFDGERAAIGGLLDGWRGWGTTALHDAVSWLPEIAIRGGSSRRAAVLLTDGVDNASDMSPEEARGKVRRARLPTYVVALRAEPPEEAGVPGPHLLAEVLAELATATGGALFRVTDEAGVDAACAAILGDLRYQYVLGFPLGSGEERYRRFRVEVSGGAFQVSYRQGYTGRSPAPADSRQ